ncbi:thioredoxin domain-containing protein [Rhodohalobacter sp.]|uniref:thioredoxin domain-containing protein n=1 Tax=Rhodohalobacter sp. TaxID=1974210 RepID=UPI002ACE5BAE|nr:thioredoxin domain-containing protein [Rhodohalobacter sp.]MDZ7756398.1 thioredoxin domain-containing protein [Rhodohalobacter sp.]
MPNKLAKEKSPYLQQHADNPVDWYPWVDEAFDKAKKENKPIFLSIGYATCHWCHVMAHESFEDPEIAEMMNEAFINIKVDREERPDIDNMYMTVCQMLTGQGGWPLTIIMSPDKEPFFAGTYIPKDARFNRIGLRQLIPGVVGMWKNEPKRVKKATEKIKEGFQQSQEFEGGKFPGTEATDFAAEQLARSFDTEHGGFGTAPKFPSPHNLMFLLRQWKMNGDQRFLDIVTETLTKMRLGGIWDHIGYGFHRYSTDREWLLPHFEKMLYDQALLLMAYAETWQATKEPLFRKTAYEIIHYVNRKLRHPAGGFYSAEDADSEGEEGKFYVWKLSELNDVLKKDELQFFANQFNIKEEGNFEDEATKKLTKANIPHLASPLEDKDSKTFQKIREQLFEKREQRIHPLLDDKVLTDWNSLMIAAFAKAGFIFNDDELIKTAEDGINFINKNLVDSGELLHRYKDGEAGIEAMADDYAFLIWALIECYETTFKPEYLEQALNWNKKFSDVFWDSENGGYFFSMQQEDQIYGPQKQLYDGAVPSSNSVSLNNLIRLSRLTGKTELEEKAQKIGETFSADLIRSGSSITQSMQAIQFLNASSKEITLVSTDKDTEFFNDLFREPFEPFNVIHFKHQNNALKLAEIAPYTESQHSRDNDSALYVCTDFVCEQPIFNAQEMKNALRK